MPAAPAGGPNAWKQTHPPPKSPDVDVGADVLQNVIPEITAVARKVGGFKKLAEIASQLDRAGPGQ